MTLADQAPPEATVAEPICVVPSRTFTVEPASATSTVPVTVCAAEVVAPPALVIFTVGGAPAVSPVNPWVSTPFSSRFGFAM